MTTRRAGSNPRSQAGSKDRSSAVPLVLALVLVLGACAPRYEFKPVPVRPIAGYPNRTVLPEGEIGAAAYSEPGRLKAVFGFDLKKAGVIPVQVRIENRSGDTDLTIVEALLTGRDGQGWEVLPSGVVYDRVDKFTGGGLSGEQGVRRTLLWGLAGGVVGAAVGVVTGSNVGEAAGKGAAIGGAVGAASAIIGPGVDDDEAMMDIQRDFSGRSLDHATVKAGRTANGLLYFPAECGDPARLSLTLRAGSETRRVELPL
jgi:hypothetical protein